MTIHHTPGYNLAYADLDTAAVDLAEVSYQLAQSIEAALTAGGLAPPNTPDLAALSARVTTVEQRQTASPFARIGALATTPAQNLTSGTYATVLLTTSEEDSHTAYTPANGRWTCPNGWAGLYEVGGTVQFAASSAGRRFGRIVRTAAGQAINYNSPENARAIESSPPVASGLTTLSVGPFLHRLAAGDYLTLDAYQDSATTLGLSMIGCSLTVRWLRP